MVLYTGGGGTPDGGGTAYHALTLLSSNSVPVRFVPRGGVSERFVELVPQTLVVTNIVKFCHLTDPIIGEVKVGAGVFTETWQLKQSVGE